jgi:hypothetical protein
VTVKADCNGKGYCMYDETTDSDNPVCKDVLCKSITTSAGCNNALKCYFNNVCKNIPEACGDNAAE